MLDLAFQPDRHSEVPLARQLADHLAALISAGRLVVGSRLPPTREAAASVSLARNTVAAAYEDLATRGLVAAHVGRGTFVVGGATSRAGGDAGGPADVARPTGPPAPREFGWPALFAQRARAIRLPAVLRSSAGLGPFAFEFRGGRVDVDTLPAEDLRWAFARAFQTPATLRALAAHQDPFGWPPLRREIARRLTERGISCTAGDVAVVGGLQQAIDLTARVLVDPGDAVVVEQPGYFGATLAFQARGADVLGVPVDAQGMQTDRLARLLRLRRVKIISVTPAVQSPTGVRMSPQRRETLLALADEYQVPILEDDYDSELGWDGAPLPALKARDRAGQVIYAGTFSKILFPGLRVGYVVAARALLDRLVLLRALADFGTGVVEQAALATLLATRGLERHLRRMRRIYANRRTALLQALTREMPVGVTWTEPAGGHSVWVELPRGLDPERLQQAAAARSVAYSRGELFHLEDANSQRAAGARHLGLAFTAIDEARIDAGVAQLAAALREAQTGAGARRRTPGGTRAPAVARTDTHRRRSPSRKSTTRR